MEALRRIFAILVADLRERTRTRRFWVVLGLVGIATWLCFPAIDSGQLAVSVDGARGRYSSAWTGFTLSLVYSTLLAWLGFYLVRGTVLRDFDTRVWQLLVATPMTRAGYLIAKWGSHMAVFSLVLAVGLAVGVLAQWVRGEDRVFDLVELVKPVLVITLPALSLTAFFAIVFDMVPVLRRTGGNVLYFFVWLLLFAGLSTTFDQGADAPRTQFMSDPSGFILASHSFAHALAHEVPSIDFTSVSVTIGVGELGQLKGQPRLFEWMAWHIDASVLPGRVFWLALGLIGSAALAPFLDRAAARTAAAPAADHAGRRLRWLDRVLAPLERGAFGTLLAAELRLALRRRSLLWWAVLLIAGIVQLAGPLPTAAAAAVVAWMLGIDVHARALLRESETRTAGLVFTAPDAARRVSLARLCSALLLSLFAVAPLLLRSLATPSGLTGAVLLVAATVAALGLAGGALFRSPRPYELAMVMLAYVGVQGSGPLAVTALSPTMLTGVAVALAASLLLLFTTTPRLAAASQRNAA
ncbi:ABC transporter permease [Lysobacter koreensis]|uniref:ABC transporter permease n=1 Tax=Lysobacter koreensis TaxID=266122 RepID=A0ABW2YMX3_9GAMM